MRGERASKAQRLRSTGGSNLTWLEMQSIPGFSSQGTKERKNSSVPVTPGRGSREDRLVDRPGYPHCAGIPVQCWPHNTSATL